MNNCLECKKQTGGLCKKCFNKQNIIKNDDYESKSGFINPKLQKEAQEKYKSTILYINI